MKRLLIAVAAVSMLAGAAAAQPAYNGSQGPAPGDYPRCTHRGQDRCIGGGGHHMGGHWGHMRHMRGHMHHMRGHHHHHGTSRDGERG